MSKKRILLISYGQFDKSILEKVAITVKQRFGLETDISVNYGDLSKFYEPSRRQYDGNQIINHVIEKYASERVIAIGLFRVDLFIPIMTYIIGQAAFKGNAGVISLYRLKNELYGMKQDDNLLFERFIKEVIHELGHIFGLTHCLSPSCVMRSSTYIEDVDQKNSILCLKCQEKLEGSNHYQCL